MLRGLNTPVAIILSEISENYWNNIIHVQSYKILFYFTSPYLAHLQ